MLSEMIHIIPIVARFAVAWGAASLKKNAAAGPSRKIKKLSGVVRNRRRKQS